MRWIRVKDREPEINQEIIVPAGITEENAIYTGNLRVSRARKIDKNGRIPKRTILYWKPIE